jgi:hypothetical protein
MVDVTAHAGLHRRGRRSLLRTPIYVREIAHRRAARKRDIKAI